MSTEMAATIEHRAGDERAVFRLSGTAGLLPALADEQGNPRTRHLRSALMAVPAVIRVDVIEVRSDKPKCNVVVHWASGADPAGVSQQAWSAMQAARPDIALRRAFWLTLDEAGKILTEGER